jgi:hypothetical protein
MASPASSDVPASRGPTGFGLAGEGVLGAGGGSGTDAVAGGAAGVGAVADVDGSGTGPGVISAAELGALPVGVATVAGPFNSASSAAEGLC